MKRNSSRNFKRHKTRRRRNAKSICPICNKPLFMVATAIIHRESGKKAHFDCVVRELKKYYHLNPKEDICYLGGGAFGIIEIGRDQNKKDFTIKKRIQYEEK